MCTLHAVISVYLLDNHLDEDKEESNVEAKPYSKISEYARIARKDRIFQ